MREIIFRGKIYDDEYGAWAEGFLSSEDHINVYENYQWTEYDVDPSTVGQYTGLTDKNGARIFEGDIVSVPMALNLGQKLEPMIGFIEWLNGAFSVTWKDADYGRHFAGYLEDIEVIGNIYGNPELLK